MEFGEFEVPTSAIGLTLLLFVTSLAYGVLIMRNPAAMIAVWINIFQLGVLLFVVYLFYRFVVAVETIATRI